VNVLDNQEFAILYVKSEAANRKIILTFQKKTSLLETAKTIISWYQKNKRDLPWRKTENPYYIWVSEIILQQTRVDQGTAYYHRFIDKFPTVKKLAASKESDVLKLWQGLGYYSRARNMHHAAKEIVKDHKGTFPKNYADIRSLKGIGDYTAAAISSFAFHLKYPVVDGNVYRLLSRYLGISTPILSSAAKKEFTEIAFELMAKNSPHEFNQAIMEFGAMQCKPSGPDCNACPLNDSCYAFGNNSVPDFPVKNKKTTIRKRYFYYLVVRDKQSLYLQQRKEKDIWHNLYEFPLIETSKKVQESKLLSSSEWKNIFNSGEAIVHKISPEKKHVLSHQVLHAKFIELSLRPGKFISPQNWKKVNKKNVKNYAVPRLIDRYLEEELELYSA